MNEIKERNILYTVLLSYFFWHVVNIKIQDINCIMERMNANPSRSITRLMQCLYSSQCVNTHVEATPGVVPATPPTDRVHLNRRGTSTSPQS